jgi:hypothetical protein
MSKVNVSATVVKAVEELENKVESIELSTGVVLKPKPVSTMVFGSIMRKFSRPKPPTTFNEDTGRKEVNMSDPIFVQEMSDWENNTASAIMDAMILMGTEIIKVPESMEGPVGNTWVEELNLIGITLKNNDSARERYLNWVKHFASPTADDLNQIMEKVGRLSGVSEADVTDAVEKFRSGAE